MFVYFWRKEVKTKRILRFYFSADSLERALNNIILHTACDGGRDALQSAEKLCSVIGDKILLKRLWGYLDGVMSRLEEEERQILCAYCERGAAGGENVKKIKRALARFTRRATRLADFREEIETLNGYYCLVRV